jgi:hypothetical protein
MSKRLMAVVGATLLLLLLTAVGSGQVKKVTTIQNPDGTYTIVEYPVGKETVVTLNPIGLSGATGRATILRDPSGTTIKLNLTSLPSSVTSMNVYAVDPTGAVALLGPIEVANGVGTFTTTTPLSKFMLIASPEDALTAYDANTKLYFRSVAPSGFTVIPITNAVGEQVAQVVAPVTDVVAPVTDVVAPVTAEYEVSMLGIPTFKKGDDTKLKINFAGAMEGARANIFIQPHKHGKMTEILMRFHDLKEAPKGQTFVLWAVSADHQFQRLGAIVNVHGRNEAEIESETAFDDFGLLLTTEDLTSQKTVVIGPAGHRVGVIQIVP